MKNVLYLALVFLILGCCKDPLDCSTSKETKAYFEGYNNANLTTWRAIKYPLLECDTNWAHMTFVAYDIKDAISYKWIIGAEEIENQPEVYRDGFPRNEPVPITLVVKKNPNKTCFPNDDGIDTITKIYYFTDKEPRWYHSDGSYLYFRGVYSHKPNDSFTFYMSTNKYIDNSRMDTLFDFPCKGDKIMHYISESKYNSFYSQTNVTDQKYKCDSISRFFFSYNKTGIGVSMRYYTYKNYKKDSIVFYGYQIK